MTRRRLTILFHWGTFVTLIALLSGAAAPVVTWAFAICAIGMTALAIGRGLMSKPGPKLTGALRTLHPWSHRALYAFASVTAVLALVPQLGLPGPDIALSQLYFVLLSASALHAIFHLWRHTTLGDGALRRMTPKALHNIL